MSAVALAGALFGVGGLTACAPKEVPFPIQLITRSCGLTGPLEGASHLRFRITGEGMEAIELTSPLVSREQKIPEIPAGPKRVVEVRAYDGDPARGAAVLSMGRSAPFDVPDFIDPAGTPPELANVFLRRVNELVPPSLADAPETCVNMLSARAGHTATLLPDGRVFIAGGFDLTESQNPVRHMLSEAEIYNPATGGFEQAPALGVLNSSKQFSLTPRAFHTATLLPSGQVFLAGGEAVNNAQTFAAKIALVYDPVARRYGSLELQAARANHGAAADETGRVLLIGGTNDGTPVATAEWYDPATATTHALPGSLPRVGMSVAPVQGGKFVAVAGGSDGVNLTSEVRFYGFDGETFAPSTATIRLRQLRTAAGIAGFQDASQLLLVGGYSTAAGENGGEPIASSEILSTGTSFNVSDGPAIAPRGDVCAALLADGRVLTAGGRGVDGDGMAKSSGAMELITPTPSGAPTALGAPSLPTGRHFHSCTPLADGSVLLLGGLSESSEAGEVKARVLQDAWIFMPAPLD